MHLLATAEDGSHEPQVFRMRWDQPLRRFARAYGVFREIAQDPEVQLRMSTPSHGILDPSATASVYGLADGDQVFFSTAPLEADIEQDKLPKKMQEPEDAQPSTHSEEVAEPTPQSLHAPASTEAAAPAASAKSAASSSSLASRRKTGEESGPASAALGSAGTVVPAEVLGNEVTPPPRRGSRRGSLSPDVDADAAGSSCSAMVPEFCSAEKHTRRRAPPPQPMCNFRCPIASCRMKHAREVGFESEKEYAQHMRVRHPKARATEALELAQIARRQLGRSGTAANLGGASRRGKATARGVAPKFGVAGAIRRMGRGASASRGVTSRSTGRGRGRGRAASSCVASSTRRHDASGDEDGMGPEPSVLRGNNTRAITVASGPAKGWRVCAWLEDVSGQKSKSGASDWAVRWRIASPGRSREFDSFRSSRGQCLQDEVGEAVYTQLCTATRPEVLKKITARRQVLEEHAAQVLEDYATPQMALVRSSTGGRSPQRPKRRFTFDEEAVQPKKKKQEPRKTAAEVSDHREAMVPLPGASVLATQPFAALEDPSPAEGKEWPPGVDAIMRRHPRCVFAGQLQPLLVHLRDYMLIGRGDTCDIVLDSRRTPQMVSRCHAVLNREDGIFTMSDQGSLNGVLVNGERVRGKQALANGDVITFGVPTPHPEFDYVFETR